MSNIFFNRNYPAKYPNKEIAGSKIILRKLQEDDLKKSLLWLKDPTVNKFLSQNFRELTEEQELKWYNFMQSSENDLVFAILDKKTGQHIGNCALHKINNWKRNCELGIVIGDKHYWNHGFGTDAVKCLVDFAFSHLSLNSVKLNVYQYNKRAMQAYIKCGFRITGRQKKNHLYDGEYWDTIIMEINPGV